MREAQAVGPGTCKGLGEWEEAAWDPLTTSPEKPISSPAASPGGTGAEVLGPAPLGGRRVGSQWDPVVAPEEPRPVPGSTDAALPRGRPAVAMSVG